jgi:hypothetical protein
MGLIFKGILSILAAWVEIIFEVPQPVISKKAKALKEKVCTIFM